jgi:hypothetical protein
MTRRYARVGAHASQRTLRDARDAAPQRLEAARDLL